MSPEDLDKETKELLEWFRSKDIPLPPRRIEHVFQNHAFPSEAAPGELAYTHTHTYCHAGYLRQEDVYVTRNNMFLTFHVSGPTYTGGPNSSTITVDKRKQGKGLT